MFLAPNPSYKSPFHCHPVDQSREQCPLGSSVPVYLLLAVINFRGHETFDHRRGLWPWYVRCCGRVGCILTSGHVALVNAQIVKNCVGKESDVCYSVNVPPQSVSSGQGDIYFQIQGPSSKQWIGLGQGSQMKGANIFIIYSDPSGQNVTLSPRLGKGHFMPIYDSDAQVSLLDGSGVANGTMTANVRCKSLQVPWQASYC